MKVANNPVDVLESNGVERTIQVVGLSDRYGAGIRVNGRSPGTLFGDDMRSVHRKASAAGMWSHGLPIFATKLSIVGSGRWYIPNDPNNISYPDGVSLIETGTDTNGKIFVTSTPNRYEPGSLSYFIFTMGARGLMDATGNFTMLFGAMSRGTTVDGNYDQIKEGVVIGFIRDNGTFKHVLRIYKNFQYTEQEEDYDESQLSNLKILRLEIGYLGIHPAIVNKVDFEKLTDEIKHVYRFNLENTSIANPNLALGIYLENQGNDTNIQIANGSFNYGNFSNRDASDASSRRIIDSLEITSIASGVDTVIAAYTLPEKLTMYDSISSGGATTTRDFVNTISNKLNFIKATGIANKTIYVNVYIIPKEDVTATFTPIRPFVNALERATIATVSLVNAEKIGALVIGVTDKKDSQDVSNQDILLRADQVGVITVTCAQSIDDFNYTIFTEDLF